MLEMKHLPKAETMLTYASILEKPQYYIHNRQKFLMPRSEVIDAAIAALRYCAELKSIFEADAAPPEATFNNAEDMMEWLNDAGQPTMEPL